MHKKILSMILAIAMVVSMFAGIAVTASAAESVTLSFAGGSASNGEWTFADETSGVSAVFAQGTHTTLPRWDATLVRFYGTTDKSNTLTVSAPAGGTITSIAFAMNGTYTLEKVSADSGEIDTATSTWTGSAAAVVFTSTAQTRIEGMTISYEASACDHANATSTETAATCTEAGSISYSCPDCGATWATEIAALGHNWTEEITVAATCTAEGTKTSTCSVCSATETATIPMIDHVYAEGVCTACGAAEPVVAPYELVVNSSSLKEGDKLIIVGIKDEAYYALSTTQNTNNRVAIAVTPNEDASIDAIDGVQVLTLGGAEDAWTLSVGDAYLNPTSTTTSNHLKTVVELDAYSYWTIAIDAETGVASVTNNGKTSRNLMRLNGTSDIFACYSSGQKDIYIYREIDLNACQHEWSDWTVDTAATCTAEGTQSRTCALCSESETAPIAATGHTFVYGEAAVTCSACDYNAAYTLSDIATVKASTDGATYYFKGIVTYVNGRNVYIEDATGAICVYFAEAAEGIALGDEILVWDAITTYNGLIETTNTTAQEYVKASTGNTLPLTEVTIADLLADTTNEYLCERVIIKGVTVGAVDAAANTSLLDADSNLINIYKATLAENVTANDVVNVTAVVSSYNGYQLLVNPTTATTDVEVVTEGAETTIETVSIATAKAGTVGVAYQIEGVVTFIDGRTLYVQDETGAIAVYLKANAANTAVGDKVKAYGVLKNYNGLLELDAVDETDTTVYEILSSGNTVAAQAVTIADLLADTTNEYLAELVSISNVMITAIDTSRPTYTISDGTNTITIFKTPKDADGNLMSVGTTINVLEAVVSAYNAYQLRVADVSKYEVVSLCQHETTELQGAITGDCTTDGYTGDTVCTVCGTVVTVGTVITAPGHTYEDGVCSECGEEEPAPAGPFYYTKVTAAPEAWDGTYIIVYEDGAGKAYVFNGVDGAFNYVEAAYGNNNILGTDALAAVEATIATMEGGYSIHTTAGYLCGTSGSNALKFATDAALNTIAFDENGELIITSETSVLRFNTASNQMRFRYFKSSSYSNQKAISLYAKVEGEMPACEHGTTEIKNAAEATCTEAGYTGDTYCALCFTLLESGTAIDALGHSYSYTNNGDNHTATCANCSDSITEDHTYVDGTCACGATEVVAPKPDANLVFTMNISAGAEMTVTYSIMGVAVNSYADFYLEVKKDVAGGDPITTVYGISGDREPMVAKVNPSTGVAMMYQVTYKGINAKEMGDNFSTTLYAVAEDGTVYCGATSVKSIKSYLLEKADAEASIPELKTMAIDMLKYGAAAQVRLGYNTENLVTADLTEEQLSYATQEIPEAVNYAATSGTGAAVNTNITVTSRVQLNLSCIYTTATDPNAVKCVITDSEGKVLAEIAATNKAGIMFSAIYEDVGAKQMRDVINATFYEGETAISQTVSWSVESYVAQVRAKTNVAEDELNMVNAMLTYGDAVAAYMEAK